MWEYAQTKILHSRSLSCNASVLPSLLYDAETWGVNGVNDEVMCKLNVFYRGHLILGVSWP